MSVHILSEEEMLVGIISQYVGKDLVNGNFRRYLENERHIKNKEQLDRLEIIALRVLQDLSKFRRTPKEVQDTYRMLSRKKPTPKYM